MGTVIGVLVIPGLYYLFGVIADKRKLIKDEVDEPLSEIFEHDIDARRLLTETTKEQLSAIANVYQALGDGLPRKDPAVPASPHVAAGARVPAMPAKAPNGLANPDAQPGNPITSQSVSATELPPALP